MSIWATIEAEFEEALMEPTLAHAPDGSEGGLEEPRLYGKTWHIDGRLRDFNDLDAPRALAWFAEQIDVTMPVRASLLIDIDRGPRYRYEWKDRSLVKLRGVLDG